MARSSAWGDAVADLYVEALDGALALVHADGGELATLDEARQVLSLRAQRTRPNVEPAGVFGAPSRPSQPGSLSAQWAGYGVPNPPSNPLTHALNPAYPALGYAPTAGYITGRPPLANSPFVNPPSRPESPPDAPATADEIESQQTQLLPRTLQTRAYRRGERLIGQTWQQGGPLLMSGEECRALPGGQAPADPEAAWHLAVPILRPGSLAATHVARSPGDVIGVISVYTRDPLWQFTPRDIETLTLHADRIALAMQASELLREKQSQQELLDALVSRPDESRREERNEEGSEKRQEMYRRLRDVVRRAIPAPSFAALLYSSSSDEVTFAFAERDGRLVERGVVASAAMPEWWRQVKAGGVVCVSAPEERALHPDLLVAGWGGEKPLRSLLAAPLMVGQTLHGAIVAGSEQSDVYAREHVRIFETIARAAALVLRTVALNDDLRGAERRVAMLNNAVLTLNASLDLDITLAALAHQATQLSRARRCVVFLFDEGREWLTARALGERGAHDTYTALPVPETRVAPDWHRMRSALEAGHFATQNHLDSEWAPPAGPHDADAAGDIGAFLAREQVRSWLLLPLAHQEAGHETTLGALAVYTPDHVTSFTPEVVGLLTGLASQAAAAISNAFYYQRLERAYERQKELDKLKDEFILTVSHEFRTPLTAIDGYASLLSRHRLKVRPEDIERYAGEVHQATQQLMAMIETLSSASQLNEQLGPMTITPVNARQAATQAIARLEPDAKARMMLEVPDDLWVAADAGKLPHVFSNLMSNAIKYSPESKPCQIMARVESRERLVADGRLRDGDAEGGAAERWVVMDVRDWGEGISPDDQKRLFQKFVRLSRSLTTSVRGTGLGLWICRQYLDAMGGAIWVESEIGKGSHFLFCLPQVAAPAGGAEPTSAPA